MSEISDQIDAGLKVRILQGVANINASEIMKDRSMAIVADVENRRLTLDREGRKPMYLGRFYDYHHMNQFLAGMATVVEDLL